MSDLYSLSVELPKSSIPLADLKGKTLLFVNVASKCGTRLPPPHQPESLTNI